MFSMIWNLIGVVRLIWRLKYILAIVAVVMGAYGYFHKKAPDATEAHTGWMHKIIHLIKG